MFLDSGAVVSSLDSQEEGPGSSPGWLKQKSPTGKLSLWSLHVLPRACLGFLRKLSQVSKLSLNVNATVCDCGLASDWQYLCFRIKTFTCFVFFSVFFFFRDERAFCIRSLLRLDWFRWKNFIWQSKYTIIYSWSDKQATRFLPLPKQSH